MVTTRGTKRQEAAAAATARDTSHVGKRVAKEYDGEIYEGTVVKFLPRRRLWDVAYNDGDAEEMDAEELQAAMALYEARYEKDETPSAAGEAKEAAKLPQKSAYVKKARVTKMAAPADGTNTYITCRKVSGASRGQTGEFSRRAGGVAASCRRGRIAGRGAGCVSDGGVGAAASRRRGESARREEAGGAVSLHGTPAGRSPASRGGLPAASGRPELRLGVSEDSCQAAARGDAPQNPPRVPRPQRRRQPGVPRGYLGAQPRLACLPPSARLPHPGAPPRRRALGASVHDLAGYVGGEAPRCGRRGDESADDATNRTAMDKMSDVCSPCGVVDEPSVFIRASEFAPHIAERLAFTFRPRRDAVYDVWYRGPALELTEVRVQVLAHDDARRSLRRAHAFLSRVRALDPWDGRVDDGTASREPGEKIPSALSKRHAGDDLVLCNLRARARVACPPTDSVVFWQLRRFSGGPATGHAHQEDVGRG